MPLLLNLLLDLLPGEQIPGVSARLVTVTGPVQSVHRAPLGMGQAETMSLLGLWISSYLEIWNMHVQWLVRSFIISLYHQLMASSIEIGAFT